MLHSSISILVTILWLSHPPIPKLLAIFGGLTVVIGTADLLRFNNQAFERTYENALGFFMVKLSFFDSLQRSVFRARTDDARSVIDFLSLSGNLNVVSQNQIYLNQA